jgi:drug/metabolite transporter (DMT)-like permease
MRVERQQSFVPRENPGSGAVSGWATGALAVVVVIWGLGTPAAKAISAPPLVAASVRFWLAVPAVWAIVYGTGRRMSVALLRQTALPGILFGVNMVLVFVGVHHTSVAVVTVVQSLQPAVVLLIAGRWMGEYPARWHVTWTLVGVAAVLLLVLGGDPSVRGDALGLVSAVLAMLCFTAYSLLSRRARASTPIEPLQLIAGVTLFACLAVTPVALLVSSPGDFRQVGVNDISPLIFGALIVGILGHTMMGWAHRYVAVSRSSLVLLGANAIAIVAAWPLFGERVTLVQVVAGAIVLGSVAAVISRPAIVRSGSVTITG